MATNVFLYNRNIRNFFIKATTSCYPNNVIGIIMYITIINIVDVMRVILFVIIFFIDKL